MAYHKEVENYIKSCITQGLKKPETTRALLEAGWAQADIDDTFRVFEAPVAMRESHEVSSQAVHEQLTAPYSSRIITEHDYPVTLLWVFKYPIIIIVASFIAIFFGYYFSYVLIALPFIPFYALYKRKKTTFTIGSHSLSASGVSQNRKDINVSYSALESVAFRQDYFDILFGIGRVEIILARNKTTEDGSHAKKPKRSFLSGPTTDVLDGSRCVLPGVTKENGEILESIIQDRMRETASVEQTIAHTSETPMSREHSMQILQRYVDVALRRKNTPDFLRATLLARGWLSQEIEDAFVRAGLGESSTQSSQEKRQKWFAVASILLFVLGVGVFFLDVFLMLGTFFLGFVFGIIGARSKKKKALAITGAVLNAIVLAGIIFMAGSAIYIYTTGTYLFTGDHVSQQDWVDIGLPVEEYKWKNN